MLLSCQAAGRQAAEEAGCPWAWDAWYLDDGQVLVPPQYAVAYLAGFDAALATAGGTRLAATGQHKSTARLVGTPAACAAAPPAWAAGAVEDTCRVLPPGTPHWQGAGCGA